MTEINELIVKRIQKKGPKVASLALEAVRLASHLPQKAVEEYLQSAIRRAVRERGAKK